MQVEECKINGNTVRIGDSIYVEYKGCPNASCFGRVVKMDSDDSGVVISFDATHTFEGFTITSGLSSDIVKINQSGVSADFGVKVSTAAEQIDNHLIQLQFEMKRYETLKDNLCKMTVA